MKQHSRSHTICLLAVGAAVALLATAAEPEPDPSPKLDEFSAKGLRFQCSLVKTNFIVGEPVNVSCLVTNTTDVVKPLAWHPSSGSHYCLVKGETSWMDGILPLVIPELRDAIKIKTAGSASPEFILYLPPHSSLRLLLTYKPERPESFKGRVVYDPVIHGGGFVAGDEEKAKRACIFSNTIEYEVTHGDK